ncbi:MAG: phospholipase, partial [Proteobacteria bacterium]
AWKIHLIGNARHTIDLAYYIFDRDTVGYAMLGALCAAVRRGVDVRLVVDSIGSLHPTHAELKALVTCADGAGALRTPSGRQLTQRARAQVVLFNAVSNLSGQLKSLGRRIANVFRKTPKPRISIKLNRRLHDKLLVVDGEFPSRGAVVIGGRNVSNHYFGIREDGSPDPDSYRDVELLLMPPRAASNAGVGAIAARYFQILFLHLGNKDLQPRSLARNFGVYRRQRERFMAALARIRSIPGFSRAYRAIGNELDGHMRNSTVRLAHELTNLTSRRAATSAAKNLLSNPNSIMRQMLGFDGRPEFATLRLVSPYLFFVRFWDGPGDPAIDEARYLREWVEGDPRRRIEIVSNSVLTTDNHLAQALIDMEMAPRLLLDDELRERWQRSLRGGEFNTELVGGESWRKAVGHPQIFFYQTGRIDSHLIGPGATHYGKLHAKFFIADDTGFVGTTNFDYRSRILNNEAGFFFTDAELSADLDSEFERLKSMSYRWGSPEWLQMRRALMARGGFKSKVTRWQRMVYRFLHGFYLSWLI